MSRFSIACPRINSKHAFSGRNGCENFDAETGLRYGLDDLIAFFQDAFFFWNEIKSYQSCKSDQIYFTLFNPVTSLIY